MRREASIEPAVTVGIGDPRRRDDAVGLAVARQLATEALPPHHTVVALDREFDLMSSLSGFGRAVVVAAVQLGDDPGTIHLLNPEEAEATAHYISRAGNMALSDAIELSRMLGGPEVVIIGVEPAEIVPGQTLHPKVAAAVPEAAELARSLAEDAAQWERARKQ